MENKVNYCKKCHQSKRIKSLDSVNQDLKNILGDEYQIENRCASICGVGKKKFCVAIDDEVIEADDYDTLLEKLREEYGH